MSIEIQCMTEKLIVITTVLNWIIQKYRVKVPCPPMGINISKVIVPASFIIVK